jgi:hypothetical protein
MPRERRIENYLSGRTVPHAVSGHCLDMLSLAVLAMNFGDGAMMKQSVRKVRHSTLKQKAEIIDFIVDRYKKIHGRKYFPKKILRDIVPLFFPRSRYVGRGVHKEVYAIRTPAHTRVLKISNEVSTRRDLQVYKRLPKSIRNRYFAKLYWQTKYCSLQKYGSKETVPAAEKIKLTEVGKKYGLIDIRDDNIRSFGRQFKIIDAHPSKKLRLKRNSALK